MRNLSEITIEESTGLWNAVMPTHYTPFKGLAYKYKASDTAPDRVVLMSGVERLGIYFTGKVWADSDLSKIELDQQKVSAYLKGIGIYQEQPV